MLSGEHNCPFSSRTEVQGIDQPLTLAPRAEVMAYIRSRNNCFEVFFGISCDSEEYSHMHEHISLGYYAAAAPL